MSGRPLVSVLLASRDGERYLPEALESLARQTWTETEILLVDDGSRDSTRAILERFAASHPRARVLATPGAGLAAALNAAAAEARGEFLARQDDDDLSEPGRLERQATFLIKHPGIAVLGTGARIIGPLGESLGDYALPDGEAAMRRVLRRAPPFVHGAVMLRAATFRALGGYRAAFQASQDFDLWLRLPAAAGIANLKETLYEWRRHPGGVFARARGRQLTFAALARAFAAERAERGADSVAEFERAGDLETFLASYRDRDRLALLLGEVNAREGRGAEARRWLARALGSPRTAAAAAAWWALTFAVALTPRARRQTGAEAAA